MTALSAFIRPGDKILVLSIWSSTEPLCLLGLLLSTPDVLVKGGRRSSHGTQAAGHTAESAK
jgi:hypothetical protein